MLKIIAPSQDVDALLAELRERVTEELDYRREARNQQLFARYYEGHLAIHVPQIVAELSARRLVISELADGARFAGLVAWSQAERDLAAETTYRFVFRSLYEAHGQEGDAFGSEDAGSEEPAGDLVEEEAGFGAALGGPVRDRAPTAGPAAARRAGEQQPSPARSHFTHRWMTGTAAVVLRAVRWLMTWPREPGPVPARMSPTR